MKYYTLQITRTVIRDGEKEYGCNPADIARYALEYCYEKKNMWREQIYLVFINGQRRIEGHFLLGMGGFDSVSIDKRLACVAMLGANAKYAVLVHNHPEGDCRPGQSDIKETGDLKRAFGAIGCQLLDHIIIGENSFFSFTEEKPSNIKTN